MAMYLENSVGMDGFSSLLFLSLLLLFGFSGRCIAEWLF